jgi:CubicO group peptidase (beta-lactamase class C family)
MRPSPERPAMPGATHAVALTCALVLACAACSGQPVRAEATSPPESDPAPRSRHDGPNAGVYGIGEGYPRCTALAFVEQRRCRVGAFSEFDALFPARTIAASQEPTRFRRAASEPVIRYRFADQERTLDEYLDRRPITGFLIAKGDTILVERYQYGRTDKHRLASFSMAKSIVGLLVGIAIEEGAIRSIDDVAEAYVPALAGTPYGRTPIKSLLQMRSGVYFREDYADPTSDIHTLARMTLEQDPGGSLAAVKRFDSRRAPPGELFSYSSADSVVLGLVLAAATRRPVSEYAAAKLWQPLGTEADASWIVDATGREITFAYFNAVLRDYARLGRMLASDGMSSGRSIVPSAWLRASMEDPVDTGSALTRYGYHLWLSADAKRFMLWGLRGQFVLADPETQLVLVQTALDSADFLDLELSVLWAAARAQLR